MSRDLLDANVLVALVDPAHRAHDPVHTWIARVGRKALATCSITENGLLRIVGHPKYPNSPEPPCTVASAVLAIHALPGHAFWPAGISRVDSSLFETSPLSSHAKVTDTDLLVWARAHQGRLATLDHQLATDAGPEGQAALVRIRHRLRAVTRSRTPGWPWFAMRTGQPPPPR